MSGDGHEPEPKAPASARPATFCEPVPSERLALVENDDASPVPPSPQAPTLANSNIGRYVLNRKLGEGGMGEVYQAVDVERCERVAIKTLTGVTPTSLWRFKQEFRSLADLVHPNLVQLYELFSQDDQLFLAMELVDGVEFHDFVWQRGAPDHDRIRDAVRQLAHGVGALHRAGKLHLDIKPSNVMITDEGRVVLLDFGLVEDVPTEINYAAGRRYLSGTPSFMAPEQIEPKPPGPAADCYAIGVMLYEALTGMLPHDADNLVDMLKAKREKPVLRPSARVQSVPADLDELTMRLLERQPDARAGVDEILAVLEPEGGREVGPAAGGSQLPHLYGRDAQLRQLDRALERTRRGRPVTVYIEGESGIGKTALVHEFLRRSRRNRQAVVIEARCYQRDSLPLKTVDALIDSLSAYLSTLSIAEADGLLPRHLAALVRLFPSLRRVGAVAKLLERVPGDANEGDTDQPGALRAQAFAALRELLIRIADRHPLAVFIDDLQWGDVESGWLIEDLLDGADAPAVLFVAGFRSGETVVSPLLRELSTGSGRSQGRQGVVHVQLGALRDVDAIALAGKILEERGVTDAGLADTIAAEADGSPLFIEELARHHATVGGLGSATAPASVGGFDEMVLRRVYGLSGPAQRLLRVLVVAGRPLPVAVATSAAGGSGTAGEGILRTLAAERLVREMGSVEGRQVECFHGRIRDALLRDLDEATVASVHEQLVGALQTAGGAPERLTLHLLGAGRSREAGEAALLAAAHAEQGLAFERAAALYSVALRHMAISEDRRRDLETRRATALAAAGKISSAAGLYLRNSARFDASAGASKREQMLERRRLAAEKLLETGHLEEGTAVLGSVMAPLDLALPDTSRRARRRWLGHRAWLAVFGRRVRSAEATASVDSRALLRSDVCGTAARGLGLGDPLHGAELASRHLMLALRAGDASRVAEAASFYAERVSAWGRSREADRWLDRAEALARGARDLKVEGSVSVMRGLGALHGGHWDDALARLGDAQDALKRSYTEHGWETTLIRAGRLSALAEKGELSRLTRELPRTIEAARHAEDMLTVVSVGSRCGHLVGLAADDVQRAHLLVDAAADALPYGGVLEWHVWVLHARVQIAQYAGDWDAAQQLLDRHQPAAGSSWVVDYPVTRAIMARLQASTAIGRALAAGDPRDDLRVARRSVGELRRSRRPVDRMQAALLAAEIDAAAGAEDRAAGGFEDVIASAEALGMRLHAAAARLRLGDLLGAEAGRELRARAIADFEEQSIRKPRRFALLYAPGVGLALSTGEVDR